MCGIVGVLSKNLDYTHHKVMQHLLIFDTVRGIDGTGMAFINHDNTFSFLKGETTGAEFMKESGYLKTPNTIVGNKAVAIIGHNRAATQGACNADNAHPFAFDNVIGVHNGTLELASIKDFRGYMQYHVDSQILYSELDVSDISTVWSKVDGAMALCWYDKRSPAINFARNKERSLSFAFSKDHKSLFWASEEWMIKVATSRAGKEIQNVISFDENQHYTFTYDKQGNISFEKKGLTPYQKKYYPVVAYPSEKESNYDDWGKYTSQYNRKVVDVKEFDPAESFIIKDLKDTGSSLKAIGLTEHGEVLNVFFPSSGREEIKKKIIGRGFYKGVYTPKKLNRYASKMSDGAEFFVQWENLTWERIPVDQTLKLWKDDWGWTVVKKNYEEKPAVVKKEEDYTNWVGGSIISKNEWEKVVTNCTCAWCQSVPEWQNKDHISWYDQSTFLCEECSQDSFIKLQVGIAA